MKATGIVRRIDDLGRVVIPKEIRRTMRIREGDPQLITLTERFLYCFKRSCCGSCGSSFYLCSTMYCQLTNLKWYAIIKFTLDWNISNLRII